MIRFSISAAVLVALAGCASTAMWQHPTQAGGGHDGATMALAECQSYAAGRTPMPKMQAYMPIPEPTSYRTTGSYSSYGNYGTFQATTTPSGGFASGYASGANMGANIANAYAVSAARDREEKLAAACMRTLGWIDTSLPEGQEKFKQLTSSALAAQAASKQSASDKSAQDRWIATINTFVETEAARPGGIDYRTDTQKQDALDKYVKEIAAAPGNEDKKMSWFLIEAHKRVLEDYRQASKNKP